MNTSILLTRKQQLKTKDRDVKEQNRSGITKCDHTGWYASSFLGRRYEAISRRILLATAVFGLIAGLLSVSAAESKKAPVTVAAGSETLTTSTEAARQPLDAFSRLKEWDNKLQSLSCKFRQTVHFEEAG